MFHLKNVTKWFEKTKALDSISLTIEKGEMVALIGSSGSGKTTLMRLLNGQILPSSGELLVQSADITSMPARDLKKVRRDIAYIPQDLGLVDKLQVYQNVLLGRIGSTNALSMSRKFIFPLNKELEHIHKLLKLVGIEEKLFQQTSSLSGGQQQRVAVARALYQDAHTILADEPVSSVDQARAKSLTSLLKQISVERNIGVIMSIHNTGLAREMFPRIVGLKQGQLSFDKDSPTEQEFEQLYQIPDSTY